MALIPIIKDIQETIKRECSNPADYEEYVERCLKFDIEAGAEFYGITEKQFVYACNRALLSLD